MTPEGIVVLSGRLNNEIDRRPDNTLLYGKLWMVSLAYKCPARGVLGQYWPPPRPEGERKKPGLTPGPSPNRITIILRNTMQKPKDINDYAQCVNSVSHKTKIFCVECDGWKSVEVQTMALITLNIIGITDFDLDENTARFYCRDCHANVEYLLNGHRETVIQQLQAVATG